MKRYTTYKNSGVKWIGEIPSHWETKSIKYIASCNDDNLSETTESNYVINYVEIGDVSYGEGITHVTPYLFGDAPSRARRTTQKGDVIVSTVRTYLRAVAVVNQTGLTVSTGFAVIRPRYISGSFMSYALLADSFVNEVVTLSTGISYPAITASKIMGIKIALPPLPEQRAIVSFLSTELGKIDTYMEKEQQLIDRLKELKQSVIARAVTRGINPEAKMKPSGINWIGEIPEHWQLKRLGSFFVENRKINTDLEYTEAYKFNYGSLVRKDENVDLEVVEDTYRKYTILNENDIVINGLNLNYDFVSQRVAQSYNKGIITSAYLVITPREGVNNVYFCYLLKAMDNMKLFHGMGTGIRLTLSFSDLKSQILPISPAAEQKQIVDYITTATTKIDKLIVEKTYELECMKELRQRVISDAVTGKIDIRG